jgi:hypothetical protein
MSETNPTPYAAGEAAPRATCPTLRPEVLAFAYAMEAQLRANDHKGGWKDCRISYLFERLEEEAKELRSTMFGNEKDRLHSKILPEAAGVANFAMMLADVTGSLPLPPPAPAPLTALEREALEAAKAFRFIRWPEGQPEYRRLQRALKALPDETTERIAARAAGEEGGTG